MSMIKDLRLVISGNIRQSLILNHPSATERSY